MMKVVCVGELLLVCVQCAEYSSEVGVASSFIVSEANFRNYPYLPTFVLKMSGNKNKGDKKRDERS